MNVTANRIDQMQVLPTGGPLGAEIRGVDLTHPLPDDVARGLHQALLSHCVLLFRGQEISDRGPGPFHQLLRSSGRARAQADAASSQRDLLRFQCRKGRSTHRGARQRRDPLPLRSVVPAEARNALHHLCGRTAFYGRCHAVVQLFTPPMRGLTPTSKGGSRGMRAVHRHHVESQNPPELIDHPVVCTHPDTGRKALYVGPPPDAAHRRR